MTDEYFEDEFYGSERYDNERDPVPGVEKMTKQDTLIEEVEPELRAEATVSHPNKPSTVIGFICRDINKGERVAVMKRNREDHYFRKYSGYAISKSVLEGLEEVGVGGLYILEMDVDRLLEYTLSDFLHPDEEVVYDTSKGRLIEERKPVHDSVRYDIQYVVGEDKATEWSDGEYEINLRGAGGYD